MKRKAESNYNVKLVNLNHKINRKAMILADAAASLDRGEHKEEVFNNFFFETVYTPAGKLVSRYPETAEDAPIWVL